MGDNYTTIRKTPDDQGEILGYTMTVSDFEELTEKARQLDLLLTERKAFLKVFTAIEAMPDHWAPTMRMCARQALIQATHWEENLTKISTPPPPPPSDYRSDHT